jgi:hypothetical protein
MQQVKIYTSGLFKGEARYQFLRHVKKMAKDGWRLHTVTDEGVGERQAHTGRYKAVYEKEDSDHLVVWWGMVLHARRFFQLVGGHTWEEMMFDLVVQPSIPEIGQWMFMHIASR